jgi:hypothetical protein
MCVWASMTVETFYYTETTSLTSPCTYKICPCNTNICRLRLDFVVSTHYFYYYEPVVLNGATTLSITITQLNDIQHTDIQYNDTQHKKRSGQLIDTGHNGRLFVC